MFLFAPLPWVSSSSPIPRCPRFSLPLASPSGATRSFFSVPKNRAVRPLALALSRAATTDQATTTIILQTAGSSPSQSVGRPSPSSSSSRERRHHHFLASPFNGIWLAIPIDPVSNSPLGRLAGFFLSFSPYNKNPTAKNERKMYLYALMEKLLRYLHELLVSQYGQGHSSRDKGPPNLRHLSQSSCFRQPTCQMPSSPHHTTVRRRVPQWMPSRTGPLDMVPSESSGKLSAPPLGL